MNILFLLKRYEVGGVEIVTSTLASCFIRHGHHVVLVSFHDPNVMALTRVNENVKIYALGKYEYSTKNVVTLRKILIDHNIDIVINQWGLPYIPIKTLCKAKVGLSVKVISVHHNQVNTNARLKAVEQAEERCNNPLMKRVLRLKYAVFKWVTSRSMRYVYAHSDVYEVLSPSFIELFKKFTGINNPTKLISQTNPITIENQHEENALQLSDLNKEKEIIYVGRLDNIQKKVYRVIDTWSHLEEHYPDWRLTIVGDGDDRKSLEDKVKEMGLRRVEFEGFQNPLEYYKRASILLLTSDFEGFGLVIVEGMSYGVVPFVYGTYPAIYDIVEDGKDGVILPMNKHGYDSKAMADKLAVYMSDYAEWKRMARMAMVKSRKFTLENIYQQWYNEFMKLNME